MFTPDDIAAELPPHRDDEPASLRSDIADELADHLQCALRREMLNQPSRPESAASRVLDKFGDPAAVARKLWIDALQERIMSQRLMLAACLVLAVVTGGVFVQMLQANRVHERQVAELQEQTQALTRLLHEQQTLSQSLEVERRRALDELSQQLESLKSAEPSDWNPVEIKLVSGTMDGPPAVGFEVRLEITAAETGIPPMRETSGADGVARFPRVRYGSYDLVIVAPWEAYSEYLSRRVTIQPGEGLATTIVCPPKPAEEFLASVHVNWPEDLRDRPIYVGFDPKVLYRQLEQSTWSTAMRWWGAGRSQGPRDALIAGPDGRFYIDRHFDTQRYADRVPNVEENQPEARLLALLSDEFQFASELWVMIPGHVVTRSRPGEPASDELLFGVAVEQSEEWPLFSIEPGAPGRVVITPPQKAIDILRQEFALMDAAGAKPGGRPYQPFRDLPLAEYGQTSGASKEIQIADRISMPVPFRVGADE